jgi:uncharacterized integral membrane protein (TIGR00697 family)
MKTTYMKFITDFLMHIKNNLLNAISPLFLKVKLNIKKCFYLYSASFSKIYTQYPLKLTQVYTQLEGEQYAVLSIRGNRAILRIPVKKLAANSQLIQKLHPIEACILGLLANKTASLDEANKRLVFKFTGSHKPSHTNLKIAGYYKNKLKNTVVILQAANTPKELHIPIAELVKNPEIISILPADDACQIGAIAEEEGHNMVTDTTVTHQFINSIAQKGNFLWLNIIFVFYCILLLTSTVLNLRLLPFTLPFSSYHILLPSSVFLFPLTFFIQDVVTEVYGFAYCRQMVWLSIVGLTFFVGYSQLIIHLPTTATNPVNTAFYEALITLPRHFIALVSGLLLGSFINDFLMAKSKVMFYGRFLGFRSVFSTLVGEALMQMIGSTIGWLGTLKFTSEILPYIGFSYGYKVIFSVASVPLIYITCHLLKKSEGIDAYDIDTNFNLFRYKIDN